MKSTNYQGRLRSKTTDQWLNLLETFAEVAENHRGRLTEEAQFLGLESLENATFLLNQIEDHRKALRLFREVNPGLDPEKSEPYSLAVGLLKMLAE